MANEHKGGTPKDFVRVCGVRRFQRGLDEIKKDISGHGIRVDLCTREIDRLEAMEQDEKVVREICTKRRNLNDKNEATRQLEARGPVRGSHEILVRHSVPPRHWLMAMFNTLKLSRSTSKPGKKFEVIVGARTSVTLESN